MDCGLGAGGGLGLVASLGGGRRLREGVAEGRVGGVGLVAP